MIIQFSDYIQPDVHLSQTQFLTQIDNRRKHAAEPLKRIEDIRAIIHHLTAAKRYRDNLLFVAGINFGLRCGDLTRLQIGHLVDEHGRLRSRITIQEEKTDKFRTVYMNQAVAEAMKLYAAGREFDVNDYLFPSYSNNDSDAFYSVIGETKKIRKGTGGPISVRSVERLLKELINDEMGIDIHAGTHCLRKTFAYQTIMTARDRARALEFLQLLLGHSSQSITLRYAGITDEEMRTHYENLNLGLDGMNFGLSSGLEAVAS